MILIVKKDNQLFEVTHSFGKKCKFKGAMFGHPSKILKEALHKLPNALELTENKLGELRSDSKNTN